jgi:Predicted membrane protein (DUF2085)
MSAGTHAAAAFPRGLMKAGAGLFVALCALWLLALVAAPYAAARARPGGPAYLAATAVYLAGSVICHQQAHRSFHLAGVQLPVCARCFGIYCAAPFGALLGWWLAGDRRRAWRLAPGDPRWRVVLVAAAMPTAGTVIAEWASGTMVPGPVRFAAGVPIGFAVAWFLSVSLGAGWARAKTAKPRQGRAARVLG